MKKNWVKSILLALFAVMLLLPLRVQAEENPESVLVEIPAGDGENEVKYVKYSACPEGPQDFYVYQNSVYLLDSENDRIIVYEDGKFDKCIDLGAYCNMLEILDDEIYVLAYTKKAVFRFSLEGELLETYPLGGWDPDASRVKGITKDKKVMVINSAGQTLEYTNPVSGFSRVRTDIELVDMSVRGQKEYYVGDIRVKECLSDVSQGYGLLLHYNDQTDHLTGETYVVRLEQDEIIGYCKVDSAKGVPLPQRYFRVFDGKPYILCCYADKVVVREAVFSEKMEDSFLENAGEIQKVLDARKAESAAAENNASEPQASKAADKTTLSRAQVISRAEDMRSLYWKLEEKHKAVRSSTTLPKVVEDAPSGRSFQGIPYCWGGFFGCSDTSSAGSYGGKFSDKITTVFDDGTMYMAGNVRSKNDAGQKQGYVANTIGLDCSGFVSSAYGLSKKYNTTGLKNTANFYEVADLADLQMGDMLVSTYEGHVYLYVGMKDESTYVVYDCNSTNATGKVMRREITEKHIIDCEYVGRTPWSN